jgi:cell division protein FtsB
MEFFVLIGGFFGVIITEIILNYLIERDKINLQLKEYELEIKKLEKEIKKLEKEIKSLKNNE